MTTSKALGIETNMNDGLGARVSQGQRSAGRFDSVFDGLSAAAGYAGPVAASTLYYKGNYRGADIVSAAVNSTAAYPGSNYGGGLSYGGQIGGLTKSGVSANVVKYGGDSTLGLVVGGADPMNDANAMVQESKVDNLKMLMLQQEIGMEGTRVMTLSNTEKAKHEMRSSVIQNVSAR